MPSAPGTWAALGRGDQRLASGAKQLGQELAAIRVELRHHVVQQHQGRPAAALGEQGALGEQQGEQGDALLALGAVGAQSRPVEQQLQLVPVRAVDGEAALDVARPALLELRAELVRRGAWERGR